MTTEIGIPSSTWLPAAAALAGVLIGSLAPIVVGVLNGRSEARRERLRLAVQLAIEEHHHLVEQGQRAANLGRQVGIAPISAMVAYHSSLLALLHRGAELGPQEFISMRERSHAIFAALAAESPEETTRERALDVKD